MIDREQMHYDIVIVGAGPSGLSAAIRIKQLDPALSVIVLEKGSEVGAHILSGAVLDPSGLDALLPDWRDKGAPVKTEVKDDNFLFLTQTGQTKLPNFLMPKLMNNHGNYIVSMGNVCRWLAIQAEELGVDIFPGMSCSELVWDNNRVAGVVAGEFGLQKDGSPGESYEPGMEILGKYVFLSEGVRGSLTKQIIDKLELSSGHEPQKFGLGIKEIWEIPPEKHKEGTITHTMGWPLNSNASGGGFIYHASNNQIFVGLVVHLNYSNPYLSPYEEFQRLKHHPAISKLLSGGKRIAYGARAISEGGYQSIPKVAFPGGVLLGCAAGLVNVPRIKGNHNAIQSGKTAAEAAYQALQSGREGDTLEEYEVALRIGPVGKELRTVQNVKPLWSRYGLLGLGLGGLDMWWASLTKKNLLGTISHKKSDAESTELANKHQPIAYPKPDGKLSFDRLTNVAFSGTNHDDSQPSHLQLKDNLIPITTNLPLFSEPAQRYCPAGVYEITEQQESKYLQINFQNCLHCKTCDIKDPSQNINWQTPIGGDGPNYPNM